MLNWTVKLKVGIRGAHMRTDMHPVLIKPSRCAANRYGGFSKIRDTFFGVLILRLIEFGGLYLGPPTLGNYHIPLVTLVQTGTISGILAVNVVFTKLGEGSRFFAGPLNQDET